MGDEDKRTIWCGNLHESVSEEILYELFLQGGPVQKVSIPKDRDGKQKTFGFVTYKHECSVPYALDLFDGTTLFNRQVHMKSRNNNLENSHQQQFRMQPMQPRNHDQYQPHYDQRRQVFHNELQLGQQVLLGSVSTAGHNSRPDTFDRNSKSHKNSSYRPNRHEDKRRHR
ncbi:hypothetical protein QAD02_008828 [Eretmocerus hayati]|uniref:Uncharacterized protein n=1 Tax=Eretmocerus hayati TaxID=131215 RepID=A0ACC2N903_9HYME|nr:hypothetical protein QAD02_008828 [Eretmocerus hayati]